MSVKCSGCGLVNFAKADVCRRCKNPLVVPAAWVPAAPSAATPLQGTERATVGPFDTRQGLTAWYVVALPHALIAVPLPLWRSFVTGARMTPLGLIGIAVHHLAEKYKDEIADAPEAELRSRPGALVFPIAELSAIAFKEPWLKATNVLTRQITTQGLGGASPQKSSSEMRLRLKGRDKPVRLSLSSPSHFPQFFAELNTRYPGLCRTEK